MENKQQQDFYLLVVTEPVGMNNYRLTGIKGHTTVALCAPETKAGLKK